MINPTKDEKDSRRVRRGGSWSSSARFTRVSHRGNLYPDFEGNALGFRIVKNQ
jgi:formylglycine-generating enzyme required for sulfatase activity